MTILDDIATNREQVAQRCLENPALLDEILPAFNDPNGAVVTDCAAVFRIVTQQRPDLTAPHAWQIGALLKHKQARVRREAIHAISLLAPMRPDIVQQYFDAIFNMITGEVTTPSGHAIDALGAYGGASVMSARAVFLHLSYYLSREDGKYAPRILKNFEPAAKADPETAKIIRGFAKRYQGDWAYNKETRQAAAELWEAVRWRPGKAN